MSNNSQFTSRIGYILAAAGSAVGLGNIWRFPYVAAKNGGGIFILTYIVLVATVGISLLIVENSLGRATGKGPVGAFRDLCHDNGKHKSFLKFGGKLNALAPFIIMPYYCVIGGWLTKYLVAFITSPIGEFSKDNIVNAANKTTYSAQYFGNFVSSTYEPSIYFGIFMLVVAVVVVFGVEKGVELSSKILMPLLFILLLGVSIYCICLPGAGAGVSYYLMPDFNKFSFGTVVDALMQMFFSLSLAMGIMYTYGSYMKKEDNLVANVSQVAIFDTLAAFLAGMMIIPALYVFNGEEAAKSAGPGLVFVVMPQVFASFGVIAGRIIGIAFFILIWFAAITSAISILETNVQTTCQELNIGRPAAVSYNFIGSAVVGVITVLGYSVFKNFHPLAFISGYAKYDILDTLDFLSNNIIMPISAIFTVILVLKVVTLKGILESLGVGPDWKYGFVFKACIGFIALPCMMMILLKGTGMINFLDGAPASTVGAYLIGLVFSYFMGVFCGSAEQDKLIK